MKWIDAEKLGIKGKGYKDAIGYRRLNEKDLATMTKIYPQYPGLPDSDAYPKVGRNSAGLHIDFVTDSRNIKVKWSIEYADHPGNMTFINQSGLDLYILLDDKYRYIGSACPEPGKKEDHEVHIVSNAYGRVPQGKNTYSLNLCTYDECTKLEIGIDDDASIEGTPEKPDYIAVYGTSITQGGCASRPGMIYTHQLRRNLDEEFVNLGFSGAGLLWHETTDFLVKLNPKLMILDCVANMSPLSKEEYTDRFDYFQRKFRETHPNTPILLIEQPYFTHSWTYLDSYEPNNFLLRGIVDSWNDENVYYVKGDHIYGDDFEGAVDGVHATDLSFYRMVQIVEPVIRKILSK